MADGQRTSGWIARHRVPLYVIMNGGVLLAALLGAPAHDIPFGRAVYALLLFATCSLPLLSLSALNGRFFVLAVFMALYFLFFGALDLQALLLGEDLHPIHEGFLSPGEVLILSAAVLVLGGYFAGVRLAGPARAAQPPKEWPKHSILLVGILLWGLGICAVIYFQIFTVPEKTNSSAQRGFAAMGPFLTFVVMLGHMVEPLGALILAYGYARFRGVLWLALIVLVVGVNVVVGFITDIKAQAMIAGAIVILSRILVDNRLPKAWLAGGLAFIVLAFPVFQAYRVEVEGERGLTRLQALREWPKVLSIALAAREKVTDGNRQLRAQSFVERSSSKGNIELLLEHVGQDVPYLKGASLVAIPMAFVPRLVAPDKEDLSVGKLFTLQVLKSGTDTSISISHLGELYWNFGWPGVLLGMPLMGVLLGFVGAQCSLEQRPSMTRLLVLVVTVQSLCMGFGGTMPVSYVLWMRGVAAIGLMHLMFARASASQAVTGTGSEAQTLVPLPGRSVPRFSNMMR